MTSLRTAALAVLLCSSAAAAQSGGNLYLSQGKVFFQGLEFEKCVQRMEQATRWKDSTRRELAEIELYSGLCKFSLGQREEADDHFALAVQMDPTLQLPPAISPRIAEAFDAVAARVRPAAAGRAEAAQAAQQAEQQAPTAEVPRRANLVPTPPPEGTVSEALTVQPAGPSRVLPITLGGVSAAAAVAGGILGNMARTYEAKHNDRTTFFQDAQTAGRDANNAALAANVGFGLAAAAAVGAVTTLLLGM
jgi:hypothetical protein